MKNWETLETDVVMLLDKHYSKGRGGKNIEMVVIHHNGGINSTKGVWDIWQYRAASAHYQVESNGVIGQLVWDRDTAWHAANSNINQRSIGIEVSNSGGAAAGWPITDKAIEETAHLVAAICRYYKLGRPQSGKNVRFHNEFAATACPVHLAPGGKYHHQLISRAQFWFDQMSNPTPQESFLSALNPHEQRLLFDRVAVIHRELTQRLPSRSIYRANDEPVDTLAGMLLNADARVHELWIEEQAEKRNMAPKAFADRLNGVSK